MFRLVGQPFQREGFYVVTCGVGEENSVLNSVLNVETI
jgi:hypothetical protein